MPSSVRFRADRLEFRPHNLLDRAITERGILPPSWCVILRQMIELGLDTFGDVTFDKEGRPVSQAQALRNVVAEGALADQLGVDAFGVGEHHRPDFAVSAPEVVLAAIAGKTERIRLGSAVTVLSTDDPIRVFQRFSTLNAISNGRAEVILGRGSFTESYPLFGYDLSKYNELFEEKLATFVKLLDQQPIVYPPIETGRLNTWVGVGGSPESVVRAARYGLPLTLAIIGGSARRFLPYVDLYKRALKEFGKEPQPIGVHSPGHLAATDEEAKEQVWPHYLAMMNRIGRERGWPPRGRDDFEREAGPDGALYVGSPETVAAKILRTVKDLGLARFDLKYSSGTLPHELAMNSIELYATKVAPIVRNSLGDSQEPVTPLGRSDATV